MVSVKQDLLLNLNIIDLILLQDNILVQTFHRVHFAILRIFNQENLSE